MMPDSVRRFRGYLVVALVTGIAACAAPLERHDLLISNVTVIDPRSATVNAGQCVVIDGDRVSSVASCAGEIAATTEIDGRGRWLLPGLWDMHVHALWDRSLYRPFFKDFLDYGVVGVRDMASTPAVLAEVRDYLAQPGVIAPRLLVSGPVVDGPEPLMPGHAIAVSTPVDARAAVTSLAAIDVDFVKPYVLLGREAGLALFDEARRQGLPVAGHLPASMSARDAIDGGMASIEHMAGEEHALLLAGTDAGELFVPPGLSLHDELALLVTAGLSEMEALRSASSRPAMFLGLPDYGCIGPGAVASLLLLERNPLADIRNSRAIAAVILDGKRLPRPAVH